MPRKIIELTLQLDIQKVSCPGVWLCQDGRVSLTIFALDTSYQTCLLPPIFPLMFQDVFYFRKRFQETCAVNNICCLLKKETIYCELVQWTESGSSSECVILAQYLGGLNDILFPSNMCSNEGVDLLMRRTKDFPGILAPKIEVSTKVRLDEIFGESYNSPEKALTIKACSCNCKGADTELMRQKQVCHSPLYHRHVHGVPCHRKRRSGSGSRNCLSKNNSSVCSLKEADLSCTCPNPMDTKSRVSVICPPGRRAGQLCREYAVYSARVPSVNEQWARVASPCSVANDSEISHDQRSSLGYPDEGSSDHKLLLKSKYIDQPDNSNDYSAKTQRSKLRAIPKMPCTCEICRKYHEMFKSTSSKSVNTQDSDCSY